MDLTEKFFGSFQHAAGAKMYRTGSFRILPDGNRIYGGLDDQVKIRGFRIEPSEIESVCSCSAVQQAVVVAKEDASSEKD